VAKRTDLPDDRDVKTDLDPEDWDDFRRQAHRMLDDMVSFLQTLRDRPAWQPVPDWVKTELTAGIPRGPTDLGDVYRDFQTLILPYGNGNLHPGFHGWVHGAGTPTGMLADMLAAGLNANLGGRDHAAIYVERQVIDWAIDIFGFPKGASGLLVNGTSMANLIALLVARAKHLGLSVREQGLGEAGAKLVAYTSAAAHGCIAKAMDMAGFGTAALRHIAVDQDQRIDLDALSRAIAEDRARGLTPFLLIGTAGTVDTGAFDSLDDLADIAAEQSMWFHVDGAFGALAVMAPELRSLVDGLSRADSLAFDFHKWLHVPYDCGCVLVRDGALHHQSFESAPAYLARAERGTGAGAPWFCDFGPDLSRGFRALKVWFTLRQFGIDRLGAAMLHDCRLAAYLVDRIATESELELLAPVALNIVCFRFKAEVPDLNRLNANLVIDVQERGIAVPSTTRLAGALAIRVAIVSHRTVEADIDRLVDAVLESGRRLAG
jgi:glutamate/tyrosine decarboxylase-like PLP-dependent enzyme